MKSQEIRSHDSVPILATLLDFLRSTLHGIQAAYHEDVAELSFIQSGSLLVDFYSWQQKKSQELMHALCSSHLDPEDLSMVGQFMSGILPYDSFFPRRLYTDAQATELDADSDEDRGLDEVSLYRLAHEEVDILKRVMDLKRAGLWSDEHSAVDTAEVATLDATPSFSSLAPPVEKTDRVHQDHLFSELHWLAQDFKRERQWKRMSAKKIALAAVKFYREKTERYMKAEKEEVLRARKLCASIARMVREFWRQIDKIVHAKQQARLSVKRQKAMTSHLGRVLETTEEYTRWLTEGITSVSIHNNSETKTSPRSETEFTSNVIESSSGKDKAVDYDRLFRDDTKQLRARDVEESSDSEYEADDAMLTDDEATIEQEEREAMASECDPTRSTEVELAQLAADATCPIEELLPPGYLDDLEKPTNDDDESAVVDEDSSYSAASARESADDETTIAAEELVAASESGGTPTNEIAQLEAEAAMPLEQLLSNYKEELDPVTIDVPENSPKEHSTQSSSIDALTAEAIKAQPSSTTMSITGPVIKTPFLLSGGTLREYQLVGLSWLATIFQKRLNGILADEMGLGKTIQTIALLAHLACEHGIWGPHLIIVPTSVILNWEMEFKRWCPGFKIISYFGHMKERRERRRGWTKTNAFHVCITSYRLAIQDAPVFKRKKWKYLILDEAQNIKNFKSQRWQTLLTFNSQRRLLLTGTPLQNSLMELWSLMHFLMPHIFQSHRDFQEWFASPLTGMIEGNSEYNEQLVARLHKVLRPFLLRRLKADVERQMPKKFEHVIMCRLSRRQRFLYDDFMSLSSTKDTLKSGQFLSVMNVLMQLRKVCNHPNLFETRPILSPFHIHDGLLSYSIPRLISAISHPFLVLTPSPTGQPAPCAHASAFNDPDLDWLDRAGAAARLLGQISNLAEMARDLPTFVQQRCRDLCPRAELITAVDSIDVVDEVRRQRESLYSSHVNTNNPFFSESVIRAVNENSRYTASFYYPPLPEPMTIQPIIVEASVPPRRCDIGMPKSILRHRATERRARLTLLSRINNRRCGRAEPEAVTSLQSAENFEFGTRIGPDLVQLISRKLSTLPKGSVEFQGLTDGRAACHRSLASWSSQLYRQGRTGSYTPIDQIGCLAGYPYRSRAPYDWTKDCTPLRMMLRNPTDYVSHMHDILNRFAFVIPPVISRGVTLSTICPQYQHQMMHQSERLAELIRTSCLPMEYQCNVSNEYASEQNVPLSPTAWLMPPQLHRIASACRIQFPDPRLIQYDCGKLQRLDLLLRELKCGHHRVLIFTQMARMLDILEQFLAYHGHRYLRLDGTTKVEQRQVLMERFNQDSQIFAFILSTRSGGLGVNLTGADTVIFYDSDWNPTMDAQAQDRCHRIGQTRDVHIYRLISERTVEENILRKANQKRFLSDVAIEGGRFTTAFFKQNTISELFAEPCGLQDLAVEKHRDEPPLPEVSDVPSPETGQIPTIVTRSGRQVKPRGDLSVLAALAPSTAAQATSPDENQLTALLETCEDENDRMAAERALAEARADLAEFDETIPLEPGSGAATSSTRPNTDEAGDVAPPASTEPDPIVQFALERRRNLQRVGTPANNASDNLCAAEDGVESDMNQVVESELAEFESTLRPVERLAVRHVEDQLEGMLNEELEMAEVQLSESKEVWRLDQLKALHLADEEKAEIEEDDMLYCYGTYDPRAQQRAELERLEKLIAEEEAAVNHGSRGYRRKHGVPTGSEASKPATKMPRQEAPQVSTGMELVRLPANRRDATERLAKRACYIDASSGSNQSSDLSDVEAYTPGKGRSTRGKSSVQEWEIFEPATSYQETKVGEPAQNRVPKISTIQSKGKVDRGGKRKAVSSSSERSAKLLRVHTPSTHDRTIQHARPKFITSPGTFRRSVGLYAGRNSMRHPVRQRSFSRPSVPPHTSTSPPPPPPTSHERSFFDSIQSGQFVQMKHTPHILRSPLTTVPPAPRIVTQSASSTIIRHPHPDFVVYRATTPNPRTPFIRPAEPMVPVQSIPNGRRMDMPASQLFTPNGQPVFVITRQLKTPSGEIYQQRFTHPVIPPTQFTQAVQRLTTPIRNISSPANFPPSSNYSVIRVVSSPRIPTCTSQNLDHSHIRVSTAPNSTVNGIPTRDSVACDAITVSPSPNQKSIRITPVVRVWPSNPRSGTPVSLANTMITGHVRTVAPSLANKLQSKTSPHT